MNFLSKNRHESGAVLARGVLGKTSYGLLVAIGLLLQTGTVSAQSKEGALAPNVNDPTKSPATTLSTDLPAPLPNETEPVQLERDRSAQPQPAVTESKTVSAPTITSPLPPSSVESCSCPCNVGKPAPVGTIDAPIDPFQRKPGYGWQLAVADAANLSVHFVAGFANDKKWLDRTIPYTFVGTYVLSGPIVHLANGRLGQAGKSLGVRVVAPLVFGLLGSLVSTSEKTVAGTLLAGMSAGAVFDALVLGRGDYVGVRTSSRIPGFSPWLDRGAHSVGAQMVWIY